MIKYSVVIGVAGDERRDIRYELTVVQFDENNKPKILHQTSHQLFSEAVTALHTFVFRKARTPHPGNEDIT